MYQDGGQYQSSANAAARGRGSGNRSRGNRYRGRGGRAGQSTSNSTAPPKKNTKIKCQICKKVGHEAPRCWYRYDDDEDDQPNNRTAGAATADMATTQTGMRTVELQIM